MASSTSQSVLVEPFGITTSSLGPTMQEGALLNSTGSFGHRHAGFGGVVGVVEADGDEIADAGDAGADPRRRRAPLAANRA